MPVDERRVDMPRDTLDNDINDPTGENLDGAFRDTSVVTLIHHYTDFQWRVPGGHFGKTDKLWLSVTHHARLVFMMNFAVKTNNFEHVHHCNGVMADLFFAYDGHNYFTLTNAHTVNTE